jgi:bifunctional DNA-binding transcriptional regulator/antitoxin component of YhaV-PrlF toxin-antitoxin module
VVRVKVTVKRSGYVDRTGRVKIVEYYSVAIPKQLAQELGIGGGDVLEAVVAEVEVGGVRRRALVYYKLQP